MQTWLVREGHDPCWLSHVGVISIETDMHNVGHGYALIEGVLPQAGFLHGSLEGLEFLVTHRPQYCLPENLEEQQVIVKVSNMAPVQKDMPELAYILTEEIGYLELIMSVECDLEWFVVQGHGDGS